MSNILEFPIPTPVHRANKPRPRAEEMTLSDADYALLERLAEQIVRNPDGFSSMHVNLDEQARNLVVHMPEMGSDPFPSVLPPSENIANMVRNIGCFDRLLFGMPV
ncbi:MAG: hypothetical protein HQL54_12035 [Magnetococcales bacterium]|nr:hypothetical protein [Magnetococcales bacterium]